MKPSLTNYWKWKDEEYKFEIFDSSDFSCLKDIKQVYVFVLNKEKNRILIVFTTAGIWSLPGGKVEENEILLETLEREVKEETNRDIDLNTAKPFFYQKAYKKNGGREWDFIKTEVRYTVQVKNDLDFVSDPDNGDVQEARWVNIKDLGKYLDWGKTVDFIIGLF